MATVCVPVGTCSHCCEERPLRARPARSGAPRPLVCVECAEYWLRHRDWPELPKPRLDRELLAMRAYMTEPPPSGVRWTQRTPSLDDLDARGPDWASTETARRVDRERRSGR